MRQGRRLGQYRFRCQNGRSNRGTRYGLVQRFIDIGNQSPPPKGIPVRVRLRPAGLLQGIIKAAHKMVASVGVTACIGPHNMLELAAWPDFGSSPVLLLSYTGTASKPNA